MIKVLGFVILSFMLNVVASAQERPQLPVTPKAQESHEYAPLQEKPIVYKDWTFKDITDGSAVDFRAAEQGKKLVMVVYFAPWCPNWRNEAPVAARLYEKYKSQGFDVIGVDEYGSRDEVVKFFGPSGPPYRIVSESQTRDAREKTTHFSYRHTTGDSRKWGSPWNIFLEPDRLAKDGEVLTEKAWVVNGELIEADVDKFVREHLGATAKSETITPCKQ